MRVLMLGWEYPPHISGGLGTACEGLTTALAKHGIQIDFLVPKLYGEENAPHMHLLGASDAHAMAQIPESWGGVGQAAGRVAALSTTGPSGEPLEGEEGLSSGGVRTIRVPALLKPYLDASTYQELLRSGAIDDIPPVQLSPGLPDPPTGPSRMAQLPGDDIAASSAPPSSGGHYGNDLFSEVGRYAAAATRRVWGRKYDLVHAHDWMTFPAGVEISAAVRAPLVTHVHSLEYDRAAEGANRNIVAVEHQGLEHSKRVIAVSYYTRGLINRVHGTSLDKISVVHNGVYTRETIQAYNRQRRTTGPVVLFLGRVTFQKGPEYFVQAAAKVLQHVPDAKFVMAGSGDMLPKMKAMVEALGIEDAFRFPGFVRGADLERTFSTADVYVMPSVSEPFGIAPLEAMSYDRPVIVSKQSGVSEVLRNALKVDFWDVDKMASQIVALLELPELRRVIIARAREEIRHIHWDAAAEKLIPIYESVSAA